MVPGGGLFRSSLLRALPADRQAPAEIFGTTLAFALRPRSLGLLPVGDCTWWRIRTGPLLPHRGSCPQVTYTRGLSRGLVNAF